MFNKKPNLNIVTLRDATEEDWQKCESKHHTPTTYQYGAHPSRVYQFCPFCHIKSRLDWKDTSARFFNRLWGTVPLIINGTIVITVVVLAVYAIVTLGKIG